MPYNDTPLPTEAPATSQPLMRQNFQQIATSYNEDHVPLSSATNVGFHSQVHFSSVSAQSIPADPISILYTNNDASGHPQLFYLNSQNSNQFTANSIAGSVTLMGGIIMKWGIAGAGQSSVTFTTTPKDFINSIFNIQLTGYATGAVFNVIGTPTVAGFSFSPAVPGGSQLYWIAIGN